MNRRDFLGNAAAAAACGIIMSGCRKKQYAHVLRDDQNDMVGSHAAGAETFKPLVDEAVGKLLGRQHAIIPAGGSPEAAATKRICFVGVENKSAEELGDFKDQIAEVIDNRIVESGAFQPISRRFVQAALHKCRLRPDELFLPTNQRAFAEVLEQEGQAFDYLLFASLTSGTTRSNNSYQRDYLLTLELVNINTGEPDKEHATIRKGYHKSRLAKAKKY